MPESKYKPADQRSSSEVLVHVDGIPLTCAQGASVAGALLAAGHYTFRRSPREGAPRGPFCLMGSCQECSIRIDGVVRMACQVEVREGMQIELKGAI